MYRQSEKNLLNSNISSISSHNVVNFGPVMAEICRRVWGNPANFHLVRILASLLHWRRSTEVNKTLQDVLPSPGLVHYVHFGGACPLTEFCYMQYSQFVQVVRSPILAALLHCSRAVGVSQTLWRGTRNGIAELSQRAPLLFGWAAITLGIGPHSSLLKFHTIVALADKRAWRSLQRHKWTVTLEGLPLSFENSKYGMALFLQWPWPMPCVWFTISLLTSCALQQAEITHRYRAAPFTW